MKRITENTKITLTVKQLRELVNESTDDGYYGSPYKGYEKEAKYVIPYLKHNNIHCKNFGWLGMAGDIDIVKIDGKKRKFNINTKEEVFDKDLYENTRLISKRSRRFVNERFADYGKTRPAPSIYRHKWNDENQSGEIEIYLGKISDKAYYKSGRKASAVTIEAEIGDDGEFSASGNIWNARGTDINRGGQCLDDICDHSGDIYTQLPAESQKVLDTLFPMWKKHHLNGMRMGTPEQLAAVEIWKQKTGKRFDYDEVCEYLKTVDLYEVPDPERPGKTFEFGSRWLRDGIPEKDMQAILSIVRDGMGLPEYTRL